MKNKLLFIIFIFSFTSSATNFLTLPELADYISKNLQNNISIFHKTKIFDELKKKSTLLIDLKNDYNAINTTLKNKKIKEKFFIIFCHLGLKNIKIVNAETFKNDIIDKFFESFKEHSSSYELKSISLVCNNLNFIPKSIFKFIELAELHLAFNNLTIIPNDILCLYNLRILNLDNNQFIAFPIILFKMANLKQVSFLDNPMNVSSLSSIEASFCIIIQDPIIEKSSEENSCESTISLEDLLDDDSEENIEVI